MPEGHVLHRLAREYSRAFATDAVAVSSPQGRFSESAALIDGRTFTGAEAVGKHLFLNWEGDLSVHVHLGLYGSVTFGRVPVPEPVGLIRMRMVGQSRFADLRGPTACELADGDDIAGILRRLGPDPIRRDADPELAWRRVSSSRAALGALLMDQSVFAGVGNIYRAEVLFRHRLSPFREGRVLKRATFDLMWNDLVVLMRDGVKRGRIDTVRAEHAPDAMGRAPRADRHGGEVYVYRRAGQPCLVCGARVREGEMQGRSLFWCGRCQRR